MDRVHAGIDQPFDVDDFSRYLKLRREQEALERKQEAVMQVIHGNPNEDIDESLSPEERQRREEKEKLTQWLNKDHEKQKEKDMLMMMKARGNVEKNEDVDISEVEEVSLDDINAARDKKYPEISHIVSKERTEGKTEDGPRTTVDVFNALLQMQREQTDLMETMANIREGSNTEEFEEEPDDVESEEYKNVMVAWDDPKKNPVIPKEKSVCQEVEKPTVSRLSSSAMQAAMGDDSWKHDPQVFSKLVQMQRDQNELMQAMKELHADDLDQSIQEVKSARQEEAENEQIIQEEEDIKEEVEKVAEDVKEQKPKIAERKKEHAQKPSDKFPVDIDDFKRFLAMKREQQGIRDPDDESSSESEEDDDDFWCSGKKEEKKDIEDKEVERVVAEVQGKRDPVEFCEHIPGEIKRVKQRLTQEKAEAEMDEDERAREYEARRSQMEAIFQLLQSQEDKFGIGSMDDMENQMKLYVQ